MSTVTEMSRVPKENDAPSTSCKEDTLESRIVEGETESTILIEIENDYDDDDNVTVAPAA